MADRVLFITSNGTGLGHLTRSMAIARRLEPGLEPLIVTLSGAAPVVAEQGFEVEYVASYATPTAGSDWRWSRRLRGRLRAIMREADPRVMVFDGAHPYQALLDAMPAVGEMHRVWCRRPMWRPGANPGALDRERFFDRVLEPGELAAAADRGATVVRRGDAHAVAPIVFCEDSELLPRAEAERELGIEPGAVNVLVQLGQGEEVRAATARCLRHLATRPGVRVAALSSALSAAGEAAPGVVGIRATYPISRYLRAFDLSVAAAGYNAFHELVRFGVPSLFVPMTRQTDDQPARARHAQEVGIGRGLEGSDAPELEARLDELLDPRTRAAMAARLAELRPANGAGPAAAWLADLAATERRPSPRSSRLRRYARHPLREGGKAAPVVARVPAAAVNVVRQSATRPAARALILALGVQATELADSLGGLLDGAGVSAERALVICDDVAAVRALRASGTGVEHVPGPASAEARLAGGSYREFAAARVRLILAERRRVRRAVALGPGAAETLAAAGLPIAEPGSPPVP